MNIRTGRKSREATRLAVISSSGGLGRRIELIRRSTISENFISVDSIEDLCAKASGIVGKGATGVGNFIAASVAGNG